MKRRCKWLVLVLPLCLLLTGCPDSNELDPDATRPAGPIGQGSSGGWIDDDAIDGRWPPANSGGSEPVNPQPAGSFGMDDPDLRPRAGGPGGAFDQSGAGGETNSIYFGFDEYSLRSAERQKLEQVAENLRQDPGMTVVAEGHTSWRGTDQYNLGLSDRRANTVRDYLAQLGIDANRIQVRPVGEAEATQDVEKTDQRAVEDRRVDVIPQ